MPITKDDVRSVLCDPAVSCINFTVGDIVVNPGEFRMIRDYFEDEDIAVVKGKEAGVSIYDRGTRTLEVDPEIVPPADVAGCAAILHECVHAIVHVRQRRELRFTDEVASYIAQVTYMQIKTNAPHLPAIKVPRSVPFTLFIASVLDVVDQYKLTTARGQGARISQFDIYSLSTRLHAVAQYADIPLDQKEPAAANVSIKGNGIRQLRMAMQLGRLPH